MIIDTYSQKIEKTPENLSEIQKVWYNHPPSGKPYIHLVSIETGKHQNPNYYYCVKCRKFHNRHKQEFKQHQEKYGLYKKDI